MSPQKQAVCLLDDFFCEGLILLHIMIRTDTRAKLSDDVCTNVEETLFLKGNERQLARLNVAIRSASENDMQSIRRFATFLYQCLDYRHNLIVIRVLTFVNTIHHK